MHGFDSVEVVHGEVAGCCWVLNEESVVGISGWVLLGLKQRIKVPERTLDKIVCGHLTKTTERREERGREREGGGGKKKRKVLP